MDNITNEKLGELIKSISAGNIAGISEIYRLLGKVMLAVARLYVPQTADAEDIVHDSLIKIVMQAGTFRENKNAYAWINTVVKNTAKDFLKRKHHKDEELKEENPRYELNENGIIVKEIFKILTETERDLIVYHFWYEMNYTEIAKYWHITKSAVQKRAEKIFLKIKKFYED